MFKSLALSIKGFLRGKAEEATDLRYAGKEHIHQIKGSIEEVRTERNRIAGRGVLLESKIQHLKKDIEIALNAVRHWASVGDTSRRDRAHGEYVELQTELNEKELELSELSQQVSDLDKQIKSLEKDTSKAKNTLGKAATKQTVSRATNRVEDIHDNLRAGPLSGVIDTAEESAAFAEARRRDRNANDNSDLYSFQTATNVLSLDDILNTDSPKVVSSGTVSISHDITKPHTHHGVGRDSTDSDDGYKSHQTSDSTSTTSHHSSHSSHSHDSSPSSSSGGSDSSGGSFD